MKPFKFVVLTPVRNEAWILKAFLTATSLWADHIIIADQMSTDGSREIARSFPKVTLIDNTSTDIDMAHIHMNLFKEAEKIPGEKFLFALDADEFLVGDFMNTASWQKIIHSQPDDAFCFTWMNLYYGKDLYFVNQSTPFYWGVHASDDVFHGEFPEDRFIHEWRLPWSIRTGTEKEFIVTDIPVLHFSYYNKKRVENKIIYYQVSSLAVPNNTYSLVGLHRHYNRNEMQELLPVHKDILCFYEKNNIDLFSLINGGDTGEYYTEKIAEYIQRDGTEKYAILDIWTKEFCETYNVKDPRNAIQKILHLYLRATYKISNTLPIRVIDKIIKKIYHA